MLPGCVRPAYRYIRCRTRKGSNSITDISPLAALHLLARLHLENNQIADLPPVGGARTLVDVNLSGNPLSTLEPLAGVLTIQYLHVDGTGLSDLADLAELKSLLGLSARANRISDLSFLHTWHPDTWSGLNWLQLQDNLVDDLTPLLTLAELHADGPYVRLEGNAIDCDAQAANLAAFGGHLAVETDCPR